MVACTPVLKGVVGLANLPACAGRAREVAALTCEQWNQLTPDMRESLVRRVAPTCPRCTGGLGGLDAAVSYARDKKVSCTSFLSDLANVAKKIGSVVSPIGGAVNLIDSLTGGGGNDLTPTPLYTPGRTGPPQPMGGIAGGGERVRKPDNTLLILGGATALLLIGAIAVVASR